MQLNEEGEKVYEQVKPYSFVVWEKFTQQVNDEVKLSNTESAMLASLAENNGPLARVQSAFVDFAEVLRHNVFNCDVSTEQGRAEFISMQAQYRAIITQKELWENLLAQTVLVRPQSPEEQNI